VDFIKLFLLQAAEAMRRLRPSRVDTGPAEAGSRRRHWLERSTITVLAGLTKNLRRTNSATGTSTKDKLHTPAPASRIRCMSFFLVMDRVGIQRSLWSLAKVNIVEARLEAELVYERYAL
jgi:hypothetical protein